jgi:putative endonuclease
MLSLSCEFYAMDYYVYITTNTTKNVFYTGMTNNIRRRMREHRKNKGISKTFAGKYYCHKLIYYETLATPKEAIDREKEIKNMSRKDKIDLIKTKNPSMHFYCMW